MALPHTPPGEIVDVRPLGRRLAEEDSQILIRTTHLEVFRYAVPAGKSVQEHAAAGLMVLQCLEGAIDFTAMGRTQRLAAGRMLYLADGVPHALTAVEDASLLITIVLNRE